jgi:hypothetical protein
MNPFAARICEHYKRSAQELVVVDEDRLGAIATLMAQEEPVAPTYYEPYVLPKGIHSFISHSFYVCAFDFGTKDVNRPDVQYRVGEYSGSIALTSCFFRRFGECEIYPEDIFQITDSREATEEFFRGENLPSLLEERRDYLREAATVLKEKYLGQAWNILLEGGYRLFNIEEKPGIVEILISRFPKAFGQDRYDPAIGFYKRAQLWPLVYQGRAVNSHSRDGPDDYLMPMIEDPENFGPVIDYRIPAALRDLEILRYWQDLVEKVDGRQALERHSAEELEIRIAATFAVSELLQKINEICCAESKKLWTMVELDYKLFMMGKQCAKSHHLCRSTDY